MSWRYTDIALATVLGWVAWGIASLFVPSWIALGLGGGIGFLAVRFARSTIIPRGMVAVLDPIGVVLPLLILRQMLTSLGLPIPAFAAMELVGFLALYLAFLASAFAVIPVQLYRYGYHPLPVAGIVLGLCLYGWVTGNLFVPLVAVVGQALWVFKIGSSNYFDHILHVALVPVTLVALIARVIW